MKVVGSFTGSDGNGRQRGAGGKLLWHVYQLWGNEVPGALDKFCRVESTFIIDTRLKTRDWLFLSEWDFIILKLFGLLSLECIRINRKIVKKPIDYGHA